MKSQLKTKQNIKQELKSFQAGEHIKVLGEWSALRRYGSSLSLPILVSCPMDLSHMDVLELYPL